MSLLLLLIGLFFSLSLSSLVALHAVSSAIISRSLLLECSFLPFELAQLLPWWFLFILKSYTGRRMSG